MSKPCDCINKVNEKLKEYNGTLEINLLASVPRAMISVCKLHPVLRRKPPLLEASHCPFCGRQYQKAKGELATTVGVL